VFVGTSDDSYPRTCGISRVNGKTGERVWFFQTENTVKNDLAYENGRIWGQDSQGNVYCLDSRDGSLVWHSVAMLGHNKHSMSGVLLVGDKLIAGEPYYVSAFAKETGELLWRTPKRKSEGTPARFVYDPYRDQLIVSRHWGAITAVDLATGDEKWARDGRPVWFRTETPLVTEKMIYTCGLNSAAVVDPNTGELLKEKDLGCRLDVSGAPAFDGSTVYYPTAQKGVVAVDAETLEIKGFYPCGRAGLYTSPYIYAPDLQAVEASPILRDGKLFIAALDGGVHIYDLASGKEEDCLYVGAPVLVPPVFAEHSIYVADFMGRISRFEN
jgi:outer membrane protein assembly factor BamB